MARRSFSALAFASVILAATPALADPSPKDTADALIKQAKADDLFSAAAVGEMAETAHTKSGILCLFFPGAPNTLSAVPSEGRARGDDFNCSTAGASLNIYVFGARYGAETTLDKHMARITGDLSKMLAPATFNTGPGNLHSEHPMASLTATGFYKGKPFDALAVAVQVNGWTMTLVCLAPPALDDGCRKTAAGLTQAELNSMLTAAKAGG
jgi:hypothetical protein